MPMGPASHDWNQPPRGPAMPSFPGAHLMPGAAPQMGSQASANGAASHPAPPPPAKPPHIFVALWNLSPEVSDAELKEELAEVDFMPDDEKVAKFKEAPGAYLCGFREEYFANAFAISFNGSVGLLRSEGGTVRAAKWTKDLEWGEVTDVPGFIQTELPALRDEFVKITQI